MLNVQVSHIGKLLYRRYMLVNSLKFWKGGWKYIHCKTFFSSQTLFEQNLDNQHMQSFFYFTPMHID